MLVLLIFVRLLSVTVLYFLLLFNFLLLYIDLLRNCGISYSMTCVLLLKTS
jgi:hypothetical protein